MVRVCGDLCETSLCVDAYFRLRKVGSRLAWIPRLYLVDILLFVPKHLLDHEITSIHCSVLFFSAGVAQTQDAQNSDAGM